VLVSSSKLYSELDSISVGVSRPFSYPTSHCLLTISTTDYCSNWKVNNFDLRRLSYSRQDLKDTHHSFVWTGYKGILQHRATTQRKLSTMSTQDNMSAKY